MSKIVYVGMIVVFGIICLAVIFNTLNNNNAPIIQNVFREEEIDDQKEIINEEKFLFQDYEILSYLFLIISFLIGFFYEIYDFFQFSFNYFFPYLNKKKYTEALLNKKKTLFFF